MSTPERPETPPVDPHEWQRQEAAMRAERLALDECDDGDTQAYRQVVRALRKPIEDGLGADFAAQMASRVGARRSRQNTRLPTLELGIASVLGLTLLCMAVDWTLGIDTRVWHLLAHSPVTAAIGNRWLLALATCALASTLAERLRRRWHRVH